MKTILISALLLCSAAASAQVNRCVDAAGKVSYSDAPCATSSKEAKRLRDAPTEMELWENAERDERARAEQARLARERQAQAAAYNRGQQTAGGGGGAVMDGSDARQRFYDDAAARTKASKGSWSPRPSGGCGQVAVFAPGSNVAPIVGTPCQ